jgi:hypothetical protein
MLKLIVQTTGQFMLSHGDVLIDVATPTLVTKDYFINNNVNNGKLKVLVDNLPDETTDADVEGLLNPPTAKPTTKKGK